MEDNTNQQNIKELIVSANECWDNLAIEKGYKRTPIIPAKEYWEALAEQLGLNEFKKQAPIPAEGFWARRDQSRLGQIKTRAIREEY